MSHLLPEMAPQHLNRVQPWTVVKVGKYNKTGRPTLHNKAVIAAPGTCAGYLGYPFE